MTATGQISRPFRESQGELRDWPRKGKRTASRRRGTRGPCPAMPRAHHNRAAIADPRPASIGSNLMRGSGAWASRMPARRLRAVRQQAKATDTKKESTSSAQSGRLLSLHGTLTAIPLPSGDEAANRAGRPESGVVGWSAATERQRKSDKPVTTRCSSIRRLGTQSH